MGTVRIFGGSEDARCCEAGCTFNGRNALHVWTPADGDGEGQHVADVCGAHLDRVHRQVQATVSP